jgi:5-methylthioadenosine/S-adenosylhomocysteine deaminase
VKPARRRKTKMNIRFYNAKVYTGTEPVFDGEVWVQGSTILYAGKAKPKPAELRFGREINVKGNLVMPGLKNAHTHSAMTFLRSYADDLPLDKWLNEQVFPMEAKLTAEHIYYFAKIAFLEYIAGGITSAFDMYFEPEAMARAAAEMGFRLTFCGAVNNFGTTADKLADYYDIFNSYKY